MSNIKFPSIINLIKLNAEIICFNLIINDKYKKNPNSFSFDLLYDKSVNNTKTILFMEHLMNSEYFTELKLKNKYFKLVQGTSLISEFDDAAINIVNNIKFKSRKKFIKLNIIFENYPLKLVKCQESDINLIDKFFNINDLTDDLEVLIQQRNMFGIRIFCDQYTIYIKYNINYINFFTISLFQTINNIQYILSIKQTNDLKIFKNFIHTFIHDEYFEIYLKLGTNPQYMTSNIRLTINND